MSGDGLERIADALYALPPDRFTAARDDAARSADDRDTTAAVKRLRRPSVAAWLVNTTVREHPGDVEELLDLGEQLREAQDALDGARLRELSRARPQLLRVVGDLADRVADAAGQRIGDAARREFEATLDAALADPDAADALRTGRLMRALAPSGLEPVDLTDAVAAPPSQPPSRPERASAQSATSPAKRPTKPAAKPATKTAASKTATKTAKTAKTAKTDDATARARARARERLAEADKHLRGAETALADARSEVESARTEISDLEERLAAATALLRSAEQSRRRADTARRQAVRDRAAAERATQRQK